MLEEDICIFGIFFKDTKHDKTAVITVISREDIAHPCALTVAKMHFLIRVLTLDFLCFFSLFFLPPISPSLLSLLTRRWRPLVRNTH